jgi:hypothetical protein
MLDVVLHEGVEKGVPRHDQPEVKLRQHVVHLMDLMQDGRELVGGRRGGTFSGLLPFGRTFTPSLMVVNIARMTCTISLHFGVTGRGIHAAIRLSRQPPVFEMYSIHMRLRTYQMLRCHCFSNTQRFSKHSVRISFQRSRISSSV